MPLPSTAAPSEGSLIASRFRFFAVLWALSNLFQLFALGSVIQSLAEAELRGIIELAIAFCAAAVIFRPTLFGMIVLCALQVADAFIIMPQISNNRLLSCLINLTFLLSASRFVGSTRNDRLKQTFTAFSASVRIEVVLFYFFVVFAKLNSGFLSLQTSCASAFYQRMASNLPIFPSAPWAAQSAIYFTILCEALIPILLFFRRTRAYGIALGALFHFLLSVDYIQHTMDFGSLMLALLFLFTPLRFAGIEESHGRVRFILVMASGVVLSAGLIPTEGGLALFYYGKHILWYGYAGVMVLMFMRALSKSRYEPALEAPFRVVQPMMLLPVVLVFLNGSAPYLGIKTRSSFDMYSNLRLEQPLPNHLIMPASLDLFGYQSDLVEVIESNDPWLQSAQRRGFKLTYFEFARRIMEVPNIQVKYSRNGREQHIQTDEDRAALQLPPAWARKLLWFRGIDTQPLARCDW